MAKTYEIHPAIGIARLGLSDKYFLAPEPDCTQAQFDQPGKIDSPARTAPPKKFRDQQKNLMRQAVRFRIFECERDATGKLTAAREVYGGKIKSIAWTMHVANRKGAAHNFGTSGWRNQRHTRRPKLVIDPKSRTLTGPRQHAKFSNGTFLGRKVPLGDAKTDAAGRLIVLGGRGHSGYVSKSGKPKPLDDFANNDYWYDDTCDGPVTATVTLHDNTVHTAAPAWVIVGPFDFAPEIDSFISLYDVACKVAVERGWRALPQPNETDFGRHVLPILARVRAYRWLSGEVMRAETQDRHTAWRDILPQLRNPADPKGIKFRQMLLAHIPDPDDPDDNAKAKREVKMPRLHDDNDTPGKVLSLTRVQYRHLTNWATGQFVDGTPADKEFVCDAMDRIALEACSGGAFYPGMEAPRIMSDPSKYVASCRLDPTKLKPGKVTEGLAVPWQADFFECQADGDNAWWPATRPDKVFASVPTKPVDSQSEEMQRWDAGVNSMGSMVKRWHKLGIIRRKKVDAYVPGADKDAATQQAFVFIEQERLLPARPKP